MTAAIVGHKTHKHHGFYISFFQIYKGIFLFWVTKRVYYNFLVVLEEILQIGCE
jgi:hypothetical protein